MTSPAMDNAALRERAHRILQDADFRQYEGPDPMKGVWEQLWEQVRELLRRLLDFHLPAAKQGSPIVWDLVGIGLKVLLGLLVLAALWAIVRWVLNWYGRRVQQSAQPDRITEAQRRESHEAYVRQSQEALARKDYRAANHYLLLAAVTLVIRDALFHGSEALTNRELSAATDFSRFGNAGELAALFEGMVRFDEPRWFGLQASTEEDYTRFHTDCQRFLRALRREPPDWKGGRVA